MFKLNVGGEFFHTNFNENYKPFSQNRFDYGYENNTVALFTEAEVFLSQDLAFNVGLRSSNASIVEEFTIEPRVSVAYKIAKKSQLSLAYGSFYQTANPDYLKFSQNLKYENTNHYILNYLYNDNGKMFRAEAYFKDYSNLVKFDSTISSYNSNFNNKGFGYAKGLDLFWRDNKTFKGLDYWITYSFIDSERDYKNYEKQVTPSFIANHNFSIVTKYWVDKLKSQIGLTYSFNSGRPYDNPNETEFMNQTTKSFTNLSLGWSYLLSQQKILYLSVSNLLGANNVFGYQYANSPDASGTFQRQAVTQPASRFFFIGFFWTISDNKKTNKCFKFQVSSWWMF
jgi:outer membrane receptor for ferrienterochelin and colicin